MQTRFITPGFVFKYIIRLCHMFTVCALSGKVIYQYLYGDFTTQSKGESIFSAVLGVVLILSGFINTFLQKPKDTLKDNKGPWLKTLYAKFFISCVVLTPIPKLVGFSKEDCTILQFYTIVVFIVISPILRFYREYYTEFNKQRKFSYENMDELK